MVTLQLLEQLLLRLSERSLVLSGLGHAVFRPKGAREHPAEGFVIETSD